MEQQNSSTSRTSRVSPARLAELIADLDDTQTQVLRLLDDFHYAYGSQLQRLFFTAGTPSATTRARNRALARMVADRLIYRQARTPLPGNRHGSTEYIYALTYAGQRIMNQLREHERPYRSVTRTTAHFKHALAVTELHVRIVEAAHAGQVELVKSQGEPASHRHFGIKKVLKPDAYTLFRTTRDGRRFEVAWFIEVEHSRQGEPATIAKLNTYCDYMEHLDPDIELMPQVLFVAFTQRHRDHLRRLLDRNAGADRDVFAVALLDNATQTMITGVENDRV